MEWLNQLTWPGAFAVVGIAISVAIILRAGFKAMS
jgi:hypothetical protein